MWLLSGFCESCSGHSKRQEPFLLLVVDAEKFTKRQNLAVAEWVWVYSFGALFAIRNFQHLRYSSGREPENFCNISLAFTIQLHLLNDPALQVDDFVFSPLLRIQCHSRHICIPPFYIHEMISSNTVSYSYFFLHFFLIQTTMYL